MHLRHAAAAVVVALTVTACTGAEEQTGFESIAPSPSTAASEEAAPTPEPTEEPSAEAAAIDVSVVPPVEEMTVEYVEAVVNAIETESGKLFAAVLAEPTNPLGATPAGTIEGLDALYEGDRLELTIEEAEALAESDDARALTLPAEQYTGVTYDVLQVSYAEPGCMVAVARVNRDGSSVAGGADPVVSYLSFVRASAQDMNPTAWELTEAVPNVTPAGEPNSDEAALAATLGDLDAVLSNDCVNGEASRVS